ncbi:MAG: copper ion binding protein [Myxococcota bacterium]|nr:copper ion binding protein [Myxococcota bacterium]
MITEYLRAVWEITAELAPWLLLGAGISALLHGLLPPGFVKRHLSGRAGVLKAVALGVPLPLCSCGVIPAGLGLKKDGASDGAAVGFLISTPQTGVDSTLVAASFLGWPFALFKVAAAAVTGLVGGFLTDGLSAEQHVQPEPEAGPRPTPKQMFEHGIEMIQNIWGWLSVGVLASAALTVFVPPDALTGLQAGGGLLAMAAALLVSLPLYVCATASVPIAAALVGAGLPTGAALVFLMAGPATNVATLGAVYRTLGKRPLAIYLGTIVVGSIGFGLLFDGVIPVEALKHGGHEHLGPFAQAMGGLLIAMVAWFALQDLRLWWARRQQPELSESTALDLRVSGMTCGGCVRKVEGRLSELEGVDAFTVDLESGRVSVNGSGADLQERVVATIQEAGFGAQVLSPSLDLEVGGMTCKGCARKVEGRLRELEGVEAVDIDLESGIVHVQGVLDLESVRAKVVEAGFKPGETV